MREYFQTCAGFIHASVSTFIKTHEIFIAELYGEEDCLFMDVYVPGGVESANKKAVMVWIHGGGYTMGSGLGYPSGPLAVIGDVIVVTINYRIGPLGFLSSGQGLY